MDLEGIPEHLRAKQEARAATMEREGRSIEECLQSHPGIVNSGVLALSKSKPTSVRELALVTDDQELRDVDHRLRLCGECPKKGGRCDQPDQTTIDPAQEPYWENRFRWRTCGKWPTYNLRKRLASFGLHGDLL